MKKVFRLSGGNWLKICSKFLFCQGIEEVFFRKTRIIGAGAGLLVGWCYIQIIDLLKVVQKFWFIVKDIFLNVGYCRFGCERFKCYLEGRILIGADKVEGGHQYGAGGSGAPDHGFQPSSGFSGGHPYWCWG